MSGAVAFGDGHKLTLDNAGFDSIKLGVSANGQVDIIIASHLERQFLATDFEQANAGSEVEEVDRVGRAFAVHNELEGGHPSANRADTEVEGIDDAVTILVIVHDVQLVFHAAATCARSDVKLNLVLHIQHCT